MCEVHGAPFWVMWSSSLHGCFCGLMIAYSCCPSIDAHLFCLSPEAFGLSTLQQSTRRAEDCRRITVSSKSCNCSQRVQTAPTHEVLAYEWGPEHGPRRAFSGPY
jgi:hypothetical protein